MPSPRPPPPSAPGPASSTRRRVKKSRRPVLLRHALLSLFLYAAVTVVQYNAWGIHRRNFGSSPPPLPLPPPVGDGKASKSRRLLRDLLAEYGAPNLALASGSLPKVRVPDAERSIALLHVGKTGGSTISLQIRHGCHEEYKTPCASRTDGWIANETLASRRIEAYYHMEPIPLERLEGFTTIVVTVREPTARFLSAFAYGHPSNERTTGRRVGVEEFQKYSCFPSISYLVKAGIGRAAIPWNKAHLHDIRRAQLAGRKVPAPRGRKSSPTTPGVPPINCTALARIAFGLDATRAHVADPAHPWRNHMTFDYRQYYRSVPPDKEVVALRQERLWEDWAELNRILAGPDVGERAGRGPDVVPPFRGEGRNVSGGYQQRKKWTLETREERGWLCRLLRGEIGTYLTILARAMNLDEDDLLEAALEVDKACGGGRAVGGVNGSIAVL